MQAKESYPLTKEAYDEPHSTKAPDSFFPEVADLCRCALNRSTGLTGYFRHFDRSENLRFAIDVLARHGKNAASLLRQHVDDRNLGTRVIEAMKMIDASQHHE